jgi:hypothetical protein
MQLSGGTTGTAGQPAPTPARPVEDDAASWQAPLEADVADASEQARDVVDDIPDPEAPAAAGPRPGDLDLASASEADLAEQLHEVPFDDDDGDR